MRSARLNLPAFPFPVNLRDYEDAPVAMVTDNPWAFRCPYCASEPGEPCAGVAVGVFHKLRYIVAQGRAAASGDQEVYLNWSLRPKVGDTLRLHNGIKRGARPADGLILPDGVYPVEVSPGLVHEIARRCPGGNGAEGELLVVGVASPKSESPDAVSALVVASSSVGVLFSQVGRIWAAACQRWAQHVLSVQAVYTVLRVEQGVCFFEDPSSDQAGPDGGDVVGEVMGRVARRCVKISGQFGAVEVGNVYVNADSDINILGVEHEFVIMAEDCGDHDRLRFEVRTRSFILPVCHLFSTRRVGAYLGRVVAQGLGGDIAFGRALQVGPLREPDGTLIKLRWPVSLPAIVAGGIEDGAVLLGVL